ncbi:MAG: fimbrillin family protein, partial [Bacteroidaceae bacterium]|nr:fimbrillin family protein [Bacteroidaceae bacterium]
MKTKYLAFAAVALMFASCSNDEDFVPQDNLKDTPITVSADVADLKTRAGYDADNLPAKFYLTVTQTEEVSPYNYTNVEMTKGNGNNYTPSDNILWKDATRTPFVSAYTTADATFTVQTDQSTAESVIASDLLGAVSTTEDDVTINGDNISVRFRHLLCKLD